MRPERRDALRRRFDFRCGYCGVSETDSGAELTVDHFRPRSHGGGDDQDNLVYCCHACNEFKADFWPSDPIRRILHPLRDTLSAHVVERIDGSLEGLTETGAFHIGLLRLNRPPLVARRVERRRTEEAHRELSHLLEIATRMQGELADLLDELSRLGKDHESSPGS